MEIDKDKVMTQEDSGEAATIDQVEVRVEAEMMRIEGRAKESVAQGLGDTTMEEEGRRMQEEAEQVLDAERGQPMDGQQTP